MTDRTVHARQTLLNGQVAEVVRYNKSGKWWHEAAEVKGHPMWPLEGRKTIPAVRRPLTLNQAAGLALAAHRSEHGEWFPDLPGGRTLDAKVRKAIREKKR